MNSPTVEAALAALNVVDQDDSGRRVVHTQIDRGWSLLGADWDEAEVVALVREAAARDCLVWTVGSARATGHGLLAVDARGRRIFLETKPESIPEVCDE